MLESIQELPFQIKNLWLNCFYRYFQLNYESQQQA